MDRSYPSTRRALDRARSYRRRGLVLATAVVASALLYATTRGPVALDSQAGTALPQVAALQKTLSAAAAPADGQAATPRRVYPYSIVPGGVASAVELARVIRTDKVVAAHYAEFDVAKASEKTVTTPRAVHVSYRKGDKVYWTARKVMLAEGETLLSDGTHEMRKRCANRISDTPQLPVEAKGPTEEELDSYTMADVAIGEDGLRLAALSADEPAEAAGPGFVVTTGGGFALASGSAGDTAASSSSASFGAAAPGLSLPNYGGLLGTRSSGNGGLTGPNEAAPVNDIGGSKGSQGTGSSASSSASADPTPDPDSADPTSTGPTPTGSNEPAPAPVNPTSRPSGTTEAPGDTPSTPSPLPGSTPPSGDQPLYPAPSTPGIPQGEDGKPGQPPAGMPGFVPQPEQDLKALMPQPGDKLSGTADKTNELPLPGSLWLLAVAGAAMLLARRLPARTRA